MVNLSYGFGMCCSSKDCTYSTPFPVSCRNSGWLPSRRLGDRLDLMEDTFRFEGCKGWTVLGAAFEPPHIFSGLLCDPSSACSQLLWAGSSSLASVMPDSKRTPCVWLLALHFLWHSSLGTHLELPCGS